MRMLGTSSSTALEWRLDFCYLDITHGTITCNMHTLAHTLLLFV